MNSGALGPLENVSRLTLGGGGIGEGWGPTSREEAIATVRMAVDEAITLIDTAPLYRHCESVIGETFEGAPPAQVRFTSKCRLGTPPPGEAAARLERSLDASLAAMRLERIDLFFLHTNICADDYKFAVRPDRQDVFATRWRTYADEFIPAMEGLQAAGKIAHWGITGVGVPAAILLALDHTQAPAAVQAIANLLDSAGGMKNFAEPETPRAIVAAARARGIGVMGIRAVQAGALTARIDRDLPDGQPERRDFERAAPFRALAGELGEDPAILAHRYALGCIAGLRELLSKEIQCQNLSTF